MAGSCALLIVVFPPGPTPQFLLRLLPFELVLEVLDLAAYYSRETFESNSVKEISHLQWPPQHLLSTKLRSRGRLEQIRFASRFEVYEQGELKMEGIRRD
jgi:hypothetical protein